MNDSVRASIVQQCGVQATQGRCRVGNEGMGVNGRMGRGGGDGGEDWEDG